MKLIAYSRPDCHLCELAAVELENAGLLQYVEGVNIESDPQLLQRYELIIPVIHRPADGNEISWPFDAQMLRACFGETSNELE